MVMAFGSMHAVVGLITQVWGTWSFQLKNTVAEQILERRSSGAAHMLEGCVVGKLLEEEKRKK